LQEEDGLIRLAPDNVENCRKNIFSFGLEYRIPMATVPGSKAISMY
jgi:hypothetical protein